MGKRKGRAARGREAEDAAAAPAPPPNPRPAAAAPAAAPKRAGGAGPKPTAVSRTAGLPPPPRGETAGALAVFAAVLGVYVRTTQPAVAGGDSGELMTVAHELGTAHPPGYPLFTMYSKASEVAFQVLSGGRLSAGQAMNLGHTVLSALAAVFLFLAVSRLTGHLAPAVAAAGLFAFSPAVWTYAVVTEVFALNNFFVCLLLLLCVQFYGVKCAGSPTPTTDRLLYGSAFICGLASTNQHTIAVYLALVVPWVFLMDLDRLSLFRFLKCTAAYLLGISPYAYLVWSAAFVKSKQSWGDCLSFAGLKVHLLREEYGTFSLSSKEARLQADDFWRVCTVYFEDLQQQTLRYGWGLAVVGGLAIGWHTVRQRTWRGVFNVQVLFLAMYGLYLGFFNTLTNFPLDNPLYVGVVQRFWIQPLSLVSIFIACGVGAVQELAVRASRSRGVPVDALFTSVAVALAAAQCALHFEAQDQSANYIVRDFGRAILTGLRNNSLLLTEGDLMINSARYAQTMEGYRPDVMIVDQEMMTYPWYIASLRHNFPDLRLPPWAIQYFPGKPQGFSIRQLLELNLPHRDVYLCHGWKAGDHSWQGVYETRPWGIAQQVVLAGAGPRALRQYLAETHDLPPRTGVQLPDPEKLHLYPPHAWEWVVRNDYFNSIQAHAYYLMQVAERKQQRQELTKGPKDVAWACLLRAIELYRWLFDHHKPEATHLVYRNFGVALQTYLMHAPRDMEAMGLLVQTFQKYHALLSRTDPSAQADLDTVAKAIQYWQQHLQLLGGTMPPV